MKKRSVLLIIFLCMVFCVVCEKKYELNEILPLQSESTEIQSLQEKSTEQLTFIQIDAQIRKYLNMTMKEINQVTGCEIDPYGDFIVFEWRWPLPMVCSEDLPFAIICKNRDESYTPLYILFR